MKNNYKYIVGIDPDLKKSGFSVYDVESKSLLNCKSLTMWDLFDSIKLLADYNFHKSFFRLEKSSSKCTWHKGGKGAAMNVGKGKGVAQVIHDYLDYLGANYEILEPSGYSKIFDNESIFKKTTGFDLRTNKDARASAAMCWGYKNR